MITRNRRNRYKTIRISLNEWIEEIYDLETLTLKISTVYKNGLKHNINGPAISVYNKNNKIIEEYYYIYGNLHRENGPAVIFYNNKDYNIFHSEYYLSNKLYTKQEYYHELYKRNLISEEDMIMELL